MKKTPKLKRILIRFSGGLIVECFELGRRSIFGRSEVEVRPVKSSESVWVNVEKIVGNQVDKPSGV